MLLQGAGDINMGVKEERRKRLRESDLIARETLFILVRKCKTKFPEAYEFFLEEMDISDEVADRAAAMVDVI